MLLASPWRIPQGAPEIWRLQTAPPGSMTIPRDVPQTVLDGSGAYLPKVRGGTVEDRLGVGRRALGVGADARRSVEKRFRALTPRATYSSGPAVSGKSRGIVKMNAVRLELPPDVTRVIREYTSDRVGIHPIAAIWKARQARPRSVGRYTEMRPGGG